MDEKNKKKTLTISNTLTKKIDISSISKDGKKSFSIKKKKQFKSSRPTIKNSNFNATATPARPDNTKKKFTRRC